MMLLLLLSWALEQMQHMCAHAIPKWHGLLPKSGEMVSIFFMANIYRIELPGGELGIDDGILLRWRVNFGFTLDKCVILGAFSLLAPGTAKLCRRWWFLCWERGCQWEPSWVILYGRRPEIESRLDNQFSDCAFGETLLTPTDNRRAPHLGQPGLDRCGWAGCSMY